MQAFQEVQNPFDAAYFQLARTILCEGSDRPDRTNTGTKSCFGIQTRLDLRQGFPMITSKKVHLKSVIHELLWFLSGSTNIKYLQDNGVTIWDEWADENGDLGPVYGKQWRRWLTHKGTTVDQMQILVDGLIKDPYSRRHIVNAWNVGEIDQMALPPCHMFFQFYATHDGFLDMILHQRSCDLALGLPFNWASYAILMEMVAQQTGRTARYFIHNFGDIHIYSNHFDGINKQLTQPTFPAPTLRLNKAASLFDYKYSDIEVIGYQSSPRISFPIAV